MKGCSNYTGDCGPFSESTVNGKTMDGRSEAPNNVEVECGFDNTSYAGIMRVTWERPRKSNGDIQKYKVKLLFTITHG